MHGFAQAMPTLCPFRHQGCPQVIHQHVVPDGLSTPNILCLGLDKPKAASYIQWRYIEALGHKLAGMLRGLFHPQTNKFNDPPHVVPDQRFERTRNGDD